MELPQTVKQSGHTVICVEEFVQLLLTVSQKCHHSVLN